MVVTIRQSNLPHVTQVDTYIINQVDAWNSMLDHDLGDKLVIG